MSKRSDPAAIARAAGAADPVTFVGPVPEPLPESTGTLLPAASSATLPAPALDANGFDPDEFEWRPVPRRPRADGWTPEVQRAFVEALADTGMVESAAQAVNMSVQSAYRLRHAPGGEGLARAWDAALAYAANRLADIAFQRAIEGVDIPVFDRDGCRIGSKRSYNDRLLMFLLRAYRPDRFRLAHLDTRAADEPAPPPAPELATALAALMPVTPADPHLLMPPERLEALADGARARAEAYDIYPDLDRETYQRRMIEEDHPVAHTRRRLRHARARDRNEADRALLAELDGETQGDA
ncbi:hypothetical protein OF829_04890 [Sphingomonas sp. LB-2]|uniref:hypothetical protein n=1 Tax=Sphingomonas caeni TaxID=2984949 RepID=UPI0022326028|nr:hypothetical protein [Sphingomonas caeni]MCW3846565.1 hypothetical protein [Sphingomonas caeni]